MHRELNPHLFGNRANAEKSNSSLELPATSANGKSAVATPKMPNYLPAEVRAVEAQVRSLKIQLQAAEKKMEIMASQTQEFAKSTAVRFERFSQALLRLEEVQGKNAHETSSQYAVLAGKMTERRVTDAKIQQMVERHNHIVQSFENRLTSLHRIIAEQERQLLQYSGALEEARQEIAKLKRL